MSHTDLLLMVTKVRTEQGETAFSFYAPVLWNKLPECLRCHKLSAPLNQDRKHSSKNSFWSKNLTN